MNINRTFFARHFVQQAHRIRIHVFCIYLRCKFPTLAKQNGKKTTQQRTKILDTILWTRVSSHFVNGVHAQCTHHENVVQRLQNMLVIHEDYYCNMLIRSLSVSS